MLASQTALDIAKKVSLLQIYKIPPSSAFKSVISTVRSRSRSHVSTSNPHMSSPSIFAPSERTHVARYQPVSELSTSFRCTGYSARGGLTQLFVKRKRNSSLILETVFSQHSSCVASFSHGVFCISITRSLDLSTSFFFSSSHHLLALLHY